MKPILIRTITALLLGLIVTFWPKKSTAQVTFADSTALVAFYNSTDGPNWTNNTNWLSGPVSSWFGITTSSFRVIEINMFSNNINGPFPPEFSNLTALQELLLANNQISGTLPSGIGSFTNLNRLNLISNQLTGSIPPELGNLNNLTVLALSTNQLTGAIPATLGNLSSLITLMLPENQLTGTIPASLGNLSNLGFLSLQNNNLSGAIPPELGNLTNVTQLLLSDNQLTGTVPPAFGNLNSVQTLWLSENDLQGAIPTSLGSLPNLNQLTLFVNRFTDLPDFSGALNLVSLRVQENFFEFDDLEPSIGITDFTYSPQGNNTLALAQIVNVGDSTGFAFSVGGINNQYEWTRNFTIVPGENNDTIIFNPTTFADNGDYRLVTTNPTVPGLSLTSNPASLTVIGSPCSVTTTDSLALVALYNATDGDNWTDNSNWLIGPVCDWFGITVTGNRVTQIILGDIDNNPPQIGNNLTGTIPAELGNLDSLQYISLAGNQLTGNIPPELGNLTNLEFLILFSNQLTGSIPPELGSMSSLIWLYVDDNQLTGSIPPELGNLSNLEILSVYDNQLSGSIPSGLGSISGLEDLWIHQNQLSGTIPPELGNLTALQSLLANNNQLTGTIPPELGNLNNLLFLRLNVNALTGAIPPEIGDITNLETLALFSNQLSGPIPPEIGNLSDLSILSLQLNQLTGAIPDEMGNLTTLEFLYLFNNNLSDTIPSSLGNLTSLQTLQLQSNQLSGDIPSELGNLINLESLILFGNDLTGSIPPSVGNLDNLRLLYLNNNLLEGAVPSTFTSLTLLDSLFIGENNLTDLPDLSTLPIVRLSVQNNRFQFDDLEPNLLFSNVTYVPQQDIPAPSLVNVKEGENYTFYTPIGGSANAYQWFKDGNALAGANDDSLALSNIQVIDGGDYILEATSPLVPGLTLATTVSRLAVSSAPVLSDIDQQIDIGSTLSTDILTELGFTTADNYSLSILADPQKGSLMVPDSQFVFYTPFLDVSGTDQYEFQLCTPDTLCSSAFVNITLINDPPVVEDEPTIVEPKGVATIDLSAIISDPNQNIDTASLRIVTPPTSGAPAQITANGIEVSYTNSSFVGKDLLTIEICDLSGACTQQQLTIIVGELDRVNVYNAVTPNADTRHDFLEIEDLEFFDAHKVVIFNRWGEIVYTTTNYSNADNAQSFTGVSDDGKKLNNGTYFYVIQLTSPSGLSYQQSGSLLLKGN